MGCLIRLKEEEVMELTYGVRVLTKFSSHYKCKN